MLFRSARLCRVQEIPLYIQDGVLDLGLTGKDWVKETKADVVVVSDLIYSKVSNKPARWVLAVADDSPYQKPEDLAGKTGVAIDLGHGVFSHPPGIPLRGAWLGGV